MIVEEIARLAAEGPTDDEIERGRVQAEAQFMFRLQTVGGFGGKSDQLNAYNMFLGDPDYLRPRSRSAISAVTRAVAAGGGRALSRSRPPGRAEHRAARPDGARRCPARMPAVVVADGAGLGAARASRGRSYRGCPQPGPVPSFRFPADREVVALPNGLRVWTVRHPAIPVVTFMLLVRRGAADDPPGKEGLAAMTVDMLDEGSGDRSAIEMHEALARLGAQLDSDIGSDAALLGVTVLSRFAEPALRAPGRHRRAAGAHGERTSRACASCGCTG